jgi:carboxyl-terminal processing protease
MKKLSYLVIIILISSLSACKKDNKNNNNNNNNNTPKPTTLDLIKDSIYLYAKEDYLWFNSLPSYTAFDPRSFKDANDLNALQKELDALSQYAINPATGSPYEYSDYSPGSAKYSFIDDGTESAALNGVKGDFGLDVQYNLVNDLRIEYVYAGSPAGLAGMRRGDEITSINGSTNISYDAPGYGSGTSANLNFVSNAIYNSKNIVLKMQRPDLSTYTANLSVSTYNVNPVLKDSVYNLGSGHKVGYIVFNSFTSDANAKPKLDAAFSKFSGQGITDLVVDLRYNGGGYVSTAEYLDNLIVPAAKSGSLMYNTYYNNNLVNGTDPLLGKQWRRDPSGGPDYNYGQFTYTVADNAVNFQKHGALNVGRVFFIITGQTASASELTINNLRPEMDVQFVGEQSYGKPVGFFDLDINKYIMFTPEFSVQNSANQGGYYAGFTPGNAGYPGVKDQDDLTKDFGDPSEGLLADIFAYITTGTYAVRTHAVQSISPGSMAFSFAASHTKSILLNNKHKFTGMVFDKKLKLKKR